MQRAAHARTALAAIFATEVSEPLPLERPLNYPKGNAAESIMHLSASLRLWHRAADGVCRLAPVNTVSQKAIMAPVLDDPFTMPLTPLSGQDEPAKDDVNPSTAKPSAFAGKHLNGLQWQVAEVSTPVTA